MRSAKILTLLIHESYDSNRPFATFCRAATPDYTDQDLSTSWEGEAPAERELRDGHILAPP